MDFYMIFGGFMVHDKITNYYGKGLTQNMIYIYIYIMLWRRTKNSITKFLLVALILNHGSSTLCPRSLVQFLWYIHYKKMDKTSYTCSINQGSLIWITIFQEIYGAVRVANRGWITLLESTLSLDLAFFPVMMQTGGELWI